MPRENKIRLLIVDDHPILISGIAAMIRHEPDMEVVGTASTGAEALEFFRKHDVDLALMDIRLPDMTGVDATRQILLEFPNALIVALSSEGADGDIRRALGAGAKGYLLKGMAPQELLSSIRRVSATRRRQVVPQIAAILGEYMESEYLRTRSTEVLVLVAMGLSNKEIGDLLFIGEDAVKAHVSSILLKLQAKDRTHAAVIALTRGLIPRNIITMTPTEALKLIRDSALDS